MWRLVAFLSLCAASPAKDCSLPSDLVLRHHTPKVDYGDLAFVNRSHYAWASECGGWTIVKGGTSRDLDVDDVQASGDQLCFVRREYARCEKDSDWTKLDPKTVDVTFFEGKLVELLDSGRLIIGSRCLALLNSTSIDVMIERVEGGGSMYWILLVPPLFFSLALAYRHCRR